MFDRRRAVIVGLVLLSAAVASADVLYLKKGGRIEGIVVSDANGSITMDVGLGRVSVSRDSVSRVERKDSALAEYRARLSRIEPGDVRAYVELARFAMDSGLRKESLTVWSRVASLDPRNVEAHLALGHVLIDGEFVDEATANRAQGLVYFDRRWMTEMEQASLLREHEQRVIDERRFEESRRAARDADERARRAEAEAARSRAETAASSAIPLWPYGAPVIVGSPAFGGYTAGCVGAACTTVPQIWPAPTPIPPPPPPPVRQPVPARSWR